jgi:glutathione synthase/RimK-type ligase-like ATP-grasp enzyme
MIAINRAKGGFDERWISYCQLHSIPFKIVDSYSSEIVDQLKDCDHFMWQFYQSSPKDILFAKQLLFSLEYSGKKVFPNFWTMWHFDDKLGQKYLLENIDAPIAATWVFYDKQEALQWANKTNYPKVFKLRCGAGSQNVRLVYSRKIACKYIRKAFGRGFSAYYAIGNIKERWRLYRSGKSNLKDLLEGVVRFVLPPAFAKVKGHEKGYIYFQEFIAGNDHDIRVVVIGNKAFAIKRMVRRNDFRASGSGQILYDRNLFDENIIRLSFDLASRLKCQCVAFDYIHQNMKPLLVEISYGFSPVPYELCPGFWDKDLVWHEGKFNPCGWMVDDLIKSFEGKTYIE